MNPGGEFNESLKRIVESLITHYSPERIILFGSYAHGIPNEDSDVDLFIVKETDRPFFKRLMEVRQIISGCRRGIPLDLIVFTPQELDERLRLGDDFVKEILTEGRVLYERS